MRAAPSALPGVALLESRAFADARGTFAEYFRQSRFESTIGQTVRFVQDNLSESSRGVLRGLHYQLPPCAQGKLVGVLRGSAFDVAVDLRRDSPTFARWIGFTLDARQPRQVWIPPGFAHGCLALEDGTQIFYKVTAEYAPELERAVAWNDETIGVDWPTLDRPPLLSARDATAPHLAQAQCF